MEEPELARVPVLDASALVAAFASATGEELTVVGLAAAGQVGAAFVRRADGSESVLSRGGDAAALRLAARALELARSAGLPVPRYENVVTTTGGTVLLQERLPGRPPTRVDDGLLASMLGLADRLTGLLAGASWLPVPDLFLIRSGPGFCIHHSLAGWDDRTRRLLGWVHEVGRDSGSTAPGDDLVHLDFHPENVLVDDTGRITGIIDWDAAGRGDARLALVTLAFDLGWGIRSDHRYAHLSPAVVEQLDDRIAATEPTRRRVFWAHMSLRQVDWAIRHHPPEVVEHYLEFSLAGVERFALA